jgi:integrase
MTTLQSLARELIANVTVHGISKVTLGELNAFAVRSVGTERAYRQVVTVYLEWLRDQRIPLETVHTRGMMLEFLDDFGESHGQRAVDQARQALQKTFAVSLPSVESLVEATVRDRSYSFDELVQVIRYQTLKNQLATLLCFDAGLRAHECITLACRCDGSPSPHRDWSSDRFGGLHDIVIYLAIGKGGLSREVAVSAELSDALLMQRRPAPVAIRDREVNYVSSFAIGGGQALSSSFTRASNIALGWSRGLHGLRHSFARRRLATLCELFPPRLALQILSQELGHFRSGITLTYISGR